MTQEPEKVAVLVCDDLAYLHDLVPQFMEEYFGEFEFTYSHASSLREVRHLLRTLSQAWDLVISDIRFTDVPGGGARDGLMILREVKAILPESEVILVTAYTDLLGADSVVQAHRDGMFDWVRKRVEEPPVRCVRCGASVPLQRNTSGRELARCINPDCRAPLNTFIFELNRAVSQALQRIRLRRERNNERELRQETVSFEIRERACLLSSLGPGVLQVIEAEYMYGGIVCGSAIMKKEVMEAIKRVANSDLKVLVIGERGVGKELVANAVHVQSGRLGQFLRFNCGGEFGGAHSDPRYEQGRFFGYGRGHGVLGVPREGCPGILEQANNGTLFLDEIGLIPKHVQHLLLRPLDGYPFTRVGEQRERRANVRFVAATNRDIDKLTHDGLLERDFVDRLRVFTIKVPSIEERREDIPLLAAFFLWGFLSRTKTGYAELSIKPAALLYLAKCSWPDNIRGIRNVCEIALRYTETGVVDEAAVAVAYQRYRAGMEVDESRVYSPSVKTSATLLLADLQAGRRGILPLWQLAKELGEPIVIQALATYVSEYGRLPTEADTKRLFGMRYRAVQQWIRKRGYTLASLKKLAFNRETTGDKDYKSPENPT